MTEKISLHLDASTLSEGLQSASRDITQLVDEELLPAASQIEAAFTGVARTIESELSRAAKEGSLSFKALAQSITRDLAKIAVNNLVRKPIENSLLSLFGGARAAGGPVAPGAGYLVGERGPEMFVPNSAGRIQPSASSSPVSVTINMAGVNDAKSFQRSQSQLAASLMRSLSKSQRNS